MIGLVPVYIAVVTQRDQSTHLSRPYPPDLMDLSVGIIKMTVSK